MRSARLVLILAAFISGCTSSSGESSDEVGENCASYCGQIKGQCDADSVSFDLEGCRDDCEASYDSFIDCTQACSGTVAEGCACSDAC